MTTMQGEELECSSLAQGRHLSNNILISVCTSDLPNLSTVLTTWRMMTFILSELACQSRGYAFQATVNFVNASNWITKKKKKKEFLTIFQELLLSVLEDINGLAKCLYGMK